MNRIVTVTIVFLASLCPQAFCEESDAVRDHRVKVQKLSREDVKSGISSIPTDSIDSLIQHSLSKHQVPGAALAITHQGRLVYARGFGYADMESREPVEPDSLFRIASLAKPVTATAILRLCDEGKLDLDACVFSILDDYEPFIEGEAEFDIRHQAITIRQLLQHRAGWDRGKTMDPMFESARIAKALGSSPPASHEQTIRYMMGQSLDFDPGERYCYSNFGYCLLGRVIEKVSGKSYEQYVKQAVLEPLGIMNMRIGRTQPEFRHVGEVKYYDPGFGPSIYADNCGEEVPQPYGPWNLEAMDAHGGWIASAVDLVRFASGFDQHADQPLLKSDSFQAAIERPPGLAGYDEEGKPKRDYYGLGWQVFTDHDDQLVEEVHLGSLPGTSALLVRRADGICYALFYNARKTPFTSNICNDVMDELKEVIETVPAWPTVDHFGEIQGIER